MAKIRKSWREKLADDKDLPKLFEIDEKMRKRWGSGRCVIPAPREVDALMKKAGAGELTTIDEIRSALARKHRATIACPITTGIFAWIAAHAAAEARAAGETNITPYWRTLRAGGEVNGKYPGGIEEVCALLRAEGHTIITRGKRRFVAGFGSPNSIPSPKKSGASAPKETTLAANASPPKARSTRLAPKARSTAGA